MEQVETLPKRAGATGRRASKYDALFEKIMDGNVYKLTHGEDFDCTITSFYQAAFNKVKDTVLTVRSRRDVDAGVIYLQFLPRAPKEEAPKPRAKKTAVVDS